ncbi:MAG: hypothetical protein AAF447_12315 [Myxococcota bacterium]
MSRGGLRSGTLVLVLWALAPAERAQADWLAALPPCADATLPEGPSLVLAYPARGLPALVEAGRALRVYVRVAAPLTPAPGIQQARALRGFHARLEGTGAGDEAADLVYRLRVRDVRNARPRGRLMRATVRIPPWTAPGSYDLVVGAMRSGTTRVRAAVRVLARGATPRLAALPAGVPPEILRVAPVDVWVAERLPPRQRRPRADEALPIVARDAGALLRLGGTLYGLGCAFADAQHSPPLPAPPPPPWPRLSPGPDGLHNAGEGDAELRLVLGERVPLMLEPRPEGIWPSTNVRAPGLRPGRVARVRLPPGARLARGDAPEGGSPWLRPGGVASPHRPVRIEVEIPRGHGVAVAWEEDGMAWLTDRPYLDIRPARLGLVELHALAVGPGPSRRTTASVESVGVRPGGCAAGSTGAPLAGCLVVPFLGRARRPRYTRRRRGKESVAAVR